MHWPCAKMRLHSMESSITVREQKWPTTCRPAMSWYQDWGAKSGSPQASPPPWGALPRWVRTPPPPHVLKKPLVVSLSRSHTLPIVAWGGVGRHCEFILHTVSSIGVAGSCLLPLFVHDPASLVINSVPPQAAFHPGPRGIGRCDTPTARFCQRGDPWHRSYHL